MSNRLLEKSRSRFREIVTGSDAEIELAEAALLIGVEEYPALDVDLYLKRLDFIANAVRPRIQDAEDADQIISALNLTLFDELGFRGNQESYYDPRNSYLNQVLDRRLGIPITLTVIYMEVARRIGFPVYGVGLPSHFIAVHKGADNEIYIDPFNRGSVMGRAGVEDLLADMSGGAIELKERHLLPATNRQIITRMLSNLLNIHLGNYSGGVDRYTDYGRALKVMERILMVNPDSTTHIRDYGLLLAAEGKLKQALSELDRYLALAPKAPDSETIRNQINSIRSEQAKLN